MQTYSVGRRAGSEANRYYYNLGERDIRMMKVQQKINVISAIQGVFTGNVPLYQIAAATAE